MDFLIYFHSITLLSLGIYDVGLGSHGQMPHHLQLPQSEPVLSAQNTVQAPSKAEVM